MKLENLSKVIELKDELDKLNECFDSKSGIMWRNCMGTQHFEFVEHYGNDAYRVKISRSLNEKILPIIKERIREIEREIESL